MQLTEWMKENRYTGPSFCKLLKRKDGKQLNHQRLYMYINGRQQMPIDIAVQVIDVTKNKVTLKELAEMYTGGKA